jgi:hypothetical protein
MALTPLRRSIEGVFPHLGEIGRTAEVPARLAT